ncbi:MAG: thiol-disulfide isomerase/thioredoxin [Dokdonia sp.]|jgi:thiol-disulfide isomerase/thioredoxin
MKTYYSLTIILLIPFLALSQFTIEGKIMDSQNIKDLDVSIEISTNDYKKFPAVIENDSFVISGSIIEPTNSMLVINNNGKRSSIKILLDTVSNYKVDILIKKDPNIFGENWFQIETSSEYHNTWRNFYDVQNDLAKEMRAIKTDFEKKIISKKELDQRVKKLENEINQNFKTLVLQKPSNYVVPYILSGAPDLDQEYIQYYEMLQENVKLSYWGQKLRETLNRLSDKEYRYIAPTPLLGTKLKSIEGKNLSGESKSYDSKKIESKLTMIDFWASWCGPCRKENARLALLHKKYANEDFKIISFSLDDKLENWEKSSKKDNITWENISDLDGIKSKTMIDFQIKQVPRNILIDSNGNLIAVDKFGDELEKYIENYLKNL